MQPRGKLRAPARQSFTNLPWFPSSLPSACPRELRHVISAHCCGCQGNLPTVCKHARQAPQAREHCSPQGRQEGPRDTPGAVLLRTLDLILDSVIFQRKESFTLSILPFFSQGLHPFSEFISSFIRHRTLPCSWPAIPAKFKKIRLFLFVYLWVCGAGDQTHGLAHVKHELCH